jgi:hypothetical protein
MVMSHFSDLDIVQFDRARSAQCRNWSPLKVRLETTSRMPLVHSRAVTCRLCVGLPHVGPSLVWP